MPAGVDLWQLLFFALAAALVAFQAWRGWRLGVVRQVISIFALGTAYGAALLGGRLLVPFLRPLGIPDQVLGMIAGALLGGLVFWSMWVGGALLFKKTSQQTGTMSRLGYGLSGSAVGAMFGIFLVWIAVLAIRVLGTIAQSEVDASAQPVIRAEPHQRPVARPEPGSVVRGIVQMKNSLEQGAAGAVVEQVDPIPGTLYAVLAKLGQMVSSEQSVNRFLAYPGVKTLTQHPKIVALQEDPVITRDVLAKNYFALIRNARIVAAANDTELAELMRRFEFEKALDHALSKPEKHEHHTAAQ